MGKWVDDQSLKIIEMRKSKCGQNTYIFLARLASTSLNPLEFHNFRIKPILLGGIAQL